MFVIYKKFIQCQHNREVVCPLAYVASKTTLVIQIKIDIGSLY